MQEAPKTVKLSKQTVNFLKNFSTINKSILIKTGNFIDTISVNKNIISFTDIKEYIPVDMAIYDLPLFLGALSLFESPTLFFPDEKKVIIYDENTKGKTTYYYSDPDIIARVPDFNPDLPNKEIHFDLPQADIAQLFQAARVYGVEDLCVYGHEGEYSIALRIKRMIHLMYSLYHCVKLSLKTLVKQMHHVVTSASVSRLRILN